MREEWSTGHGWAASGHWNARRLVASALVVAVGLLGIGVGIARLLTPEAVAAGGGAAAVLGAVEGEQPTEIGEAAAAVREGPFVPAPTAHLTVVHLSVSACGARSTGTGIVIADGLLLSAAHVVGDADLVRIDQGGVTVTGEVLGVLADERDLALIAVDAPMAAPLVAAAAPPAGVPLTLVGHPDGGPRTAAVGARIEVDPGVAVLAGGGEILGVDVHIDSGFSGGPAVTAEGDVVGIVVAKEAVADTALVVATPDLASIGGAGLVPGTCVGSA